MSSIQSALLSGTNTGTKRRTKKCRKVYPNGIHAVLADALKGRGLLRPHRHPR